MSFVRVASLADLKADAATQVVVDGKEIALVLCGDRVCALSDICTHEHAYLSEGFVEDGQIECPLHGSMFDLQTGKALTLPATEDVPIYPVKVDGDDVFVDPSGAPQTIDSQRVG